MNKIFKQALIDYKLHREKYNTLNKLAIEEGCAGIHHKTLKFLAEKIPEFDEFAAYLVNIMIKEDKCMEDAWAIIEKELE